MMQEFMNDIAGIPYTAAHFDKDGAALDKQEVTLPEARRTLSSRRTVE
jgi:hypothetical protein